MEVYKFIVRGRVQGVFYRKFVSQKAMRKQLKEVTFKLLPLESRYYFI